MPPVGERLRVALLDLHARSSMFIDEQPFRGLPEALEARGHQVTLRQSVRGGDERAAAAWRVELAAFVAGGGFHLVVLSRAWDEETLAALRGAMAAGARLVRLTHGAPAALDEQFDVVVARADLFDLVDGTFEARGGSEVRGGSEARGPAWRSTKAELKRGLQVLPTATAPPRRIEQGDAAGPGGAVGNTGVGARPTISGPAVGCPFLLDARTSPELSSVPMDVARVQTKGCSFCLDNVGAYAAFSEADVVGAWLAGLRAARASSSDPPAVAG